MHLTLKKFALGVEITQNLRQNRAEELQKFLEFRRTARTKSAGHLPVASLQLLTEDIWDNSIIGGSECFNFSINN